jgi:hypothetical protein
MYKVFYRTFYNYNLYDNLESYLNNFEFVGLEVISIICSDRTVDSISYEIICKMKEQ